MTRKVRIILLVLAVSLCYANTARNGFMWDDDQYVTNNEQIKSLKNAPSLLVPLKTEPYRPLRLLTFSVEHSLYGLNPAMYHLDNVALHLLNVLLLFAVLLLIFKDEELAFYSALIFAVNPAWNEAVVWVKNRSMLLAGFFMLSGLYFYIKRKNPLAFIAFTLGLLSKEIVIAFPAIVTAYAFIFEPERKKIDLLPYWILGIAWTVFLFTLYGGQAGSFSPGAGLFFSLKIMLRFLLILLFPFRLNAEREVVFPETIFDAEVVISFIMTVLVLAWLYKDRFRNKALAFVLLWMVFNIFPTANPGVVAGRPLAEHRLYLVGAGFSVLLFMAVRRRKELLFLLLPAFFVTSFLRNLDWKDSFSFWSQTARVSPASPRANASLAWSYKELGDAAKAEDYFRKAIALDPGYPSAIGGLAAILTEKGRPKEAESLLSDALMKNPAELGLYKDLIALHIKQRSNAAAETLCRKAASVISINIGNVEDYPGIGVQAFSLGLFNEAGVIFRKVLELKPWSIYVINNLASVYQAEKNYPEAIKYYQLAIEKQPSNPIYYYNIGNLYFNVKAIGSAISSYKKAVELDNNYSDAWYNLGYVYRIVGNTEQAELCFNRVKEIEMPGGLKR